MIVILRMVRQESNMLWKMYWDPLESHYEILECQQFIRVLFQSLPTLHILYIAVLLKKNTNWLRNFILLYRHEHVEEMKQRQLYK